MNNDLTIITTAPEEAGQLIVIKQLPVIQEELYRIKEKVAAVVDTALAMQVSEDTVKDIKAKRAEMNKMLAAFEERRKDVKKAVLAPYENFEAVYKECVSDAFKNADAELKRRIATVEDGIKQAKREELETYFSEYCQSVGIDFVSFKDAGINITLSDSRKKLKDMAKAWIDGIASALQMISTMENADEIRAEFKANGYNGNAAVVTVNARHKAIEEEKRRAEEKKRLDAEREERERILMQEYAAQNVENSLIEPLTAPVEQIPTDTKNGVQEEKNEPQTMFCVTFAVNGTIEQLKALKNFLNEGEYNYECK